MLIRESASYSVEMSVAEEKLVRKFKDLGLINKDLYLKFIESSSLSNLLLLEVIEMVKRFKVISSSETVLSTEEKKILINMIENLDSFEKQMVRLGRVTW